MQNYNKIEIIVSDDCSKDKTVIIAKSILENSNVPFKINVNSKNKGTFDNMLIGLHFCKGEYTAYLEGDDYWYSNDKLKMQLELLENNQNISAITTQSYRLFENGAKIIYRNSRLTIFEINDILGYTPFHSSTLLFKSSELPNLPKAYKKCISNDKILYLFLTKKKPIKFVNEITSVYRIHSQNINSQTSILMKEWRQVQFLIISFRYIPINSYPKVVKVIFINHLFTILKSLIKSSH